jgi:hypothetical protein
VLSPAAERAASIGVAMTEPGSADLAGVLAFEAVSFPG